MTARDSGPAQAMVKGMPSINSVNHLFSCAYVSLLD